MDHQLRSMYALPDQLKGSFGVYLPFTDNTTDTPPFSQWPVCYGINASTSAPVFIKCGELSDMKLEHRNHSILRDCGVAHVAVSCLDFIALNDIVGVLIFERQPRDLFEFAVADAGASRKRNLIMLRKCAMAIHQLHASGLAHGDIKLENIMLTDNDDILLTDFGTVNVKTYDIPFGLGTFRFSPPEYRSRHEQPCDGRSHETLTPAQLYDIWCLGVMATLLCATSGLDINWAAECVVLLNEEQIPNPERQFILNACQFKPHERWSAEQLLKLFDA